MKSIVRNVVMAALTAAAFTSPLASASGIVDVYNESPVLIQPYFKSNCWGWALAGSTGWVYFGNIAPNGGRFGWDFSDAALTDPDCAHPVIEFTYGTNQVAPPDPQKGNRRAAVHFSNDGNAVLQIGKSLYARELEGPDENGR